LTGTWVTDELKKALEKGILVQRIYEVWHFDGTEQYDPKTKTGGLFKLSVTISGCPMGIFPVLLIYGYREVTSTYDISWSF
jgi:hypothetical protein